VIARRCTAKHGGYCCARDEGHHGPHASGFTAASAHWWGEGCCTVGRFGIMSDPNPCADCEVEIAAEVARLAAGGELRPLQRAPRWLIALRAANGPASLAQEGATS
jgi:hypothetical protein